MWSHRDFQNVSTFARAASLLLLSPLHSIIPASSTRKSPIIFLYCALCGQLLIDILPRLKPWDSNSRKKALLIPAKSITFGRFRSAAYAAAMALGI